MKAEQYFAAQIKIATLSLAAIVSTSSATFAQKAPPVDTQLQQRIQNLTDAVNRVESQMQQSQRELAELKQQLASIREPSGLDPSQVSDAAQLADAVAAIRESQAMQETQIATLEQIKVESDSKYPLKLSGMILMTGFINTRGADAAATPSTATGGTGATGATAQQTVIGIDASGPHLFGARSHADLRFDLNGGTRGSSSNAGYAVTLPRLRTAHAELNWDRGRAYFALDRPLLNPESPASLTAVAEPALAWSGNLWSWNPQVGFSRDVVSNHSGTFRAQAALIDILDPPSLFASLQTTGSFVTPASGELSRWPGVEGRVAFEGSDDTAGIRFGIGGIFAPHRSAASGAKYNTWAGSADLRIPLSRFMQLSGSAYRGAALGGLGAGAFKNAVARTVAGEFYFQPLDDIGGWVQWKQRAGERIEFNEAFGIDNVPGHQLRPFALATPVSYYNLARNRTFTGNVIYSPSAYLLFSLEYRRILSSYVTSPTLFSDVIGLAAGYKF